MKENLYYFEKLMEFKQMEEMRRNREAWRYSRSYKQNRGLFHMVSEMLNSKKNVCCIECR